MLKADAQRQLSMVRQEVVTDLLGALAEAREPSSRARLLKLAESHLKAGIAAAQRAEDLWPALEDAKRIIEGDGALKPAAVKKHLKLFEQLDGVQHRSLDLLENSFTNVRLILDRLHPTEAAPAQSSATTSGAGK